jgi:hypothetical protein
LQAEGHVAALRKLFDSPQLGCKAINLGTGTGQTVMEVGWVGGLAGRQPGRVGEGCQHLHNCALLAL